MKNKLSDVEDERFRKLSGKLFRIIFNLINVNSEERVFLSRDRATRRRRPRARLFPSFKLICTLNDFFSIEESAPSDPPAHPWFHLRPSDPVMIETNDN